MAVELDEQGAVVAMLRRRKRGGPLPRPRRAWMGFEYVTTSMWM